MQIAKLVLSLLALSTGHRLPNKIPVVDTWRQDFKCMAIAAYTEARGESEFGQALVVHTIMRREIEAFPHADACAIAKRYYDGYRRWETQKPRTLAQVQEWDRAVEITWKVAVGEYDFGVCTGATHYYNPAKVSPYWRKQMKELCVVGGHRFMAAR